MSALSATDTRDRGRRGMSRRDWVRVREADRTSDWRQHPRRLLSAAAAVALGKAGGHTQIDAENRACCCTEYGSARRAMHFSLAHLEYICARDSLRQRAQV